VTRVRMSSALSPCRDRYVRLPLDWLGCKVLQHVEDRSHAMAKLTVVLLVHAVASVGSTGVISPEERGAVGMVPAKVWSRGPVDLVGDATRFTRSVQHGP
jgi:hypothetical protein